MWIELKPVCRCYIKASYSVGCFLLPNSVAAFAGVWLCHFGFRVIASPVWSESGYGSKEDRRLNARLCETWHGGLLACVFWTDCCRHFAMTFSSSTLPKSLRILGSFPGLAALCRNRAASKGTGPGPQGSREMSVTGAHVGA